MKLASIVVSTSLGALLLSAALAHAQVGDGGYGDPMGPGMMGGWVNVATKLPAPRNAQWLGRLREILGLERESLAQYQSDQRRFNAHMPYGMVIHQEENHIRWIEGRLKAYGLPVEGKAGTAIVQNRTLTEAFLEAEKLEAELLPR